MKLGVMNPALASMPFEEAMKYLSSLGVDCVELGAGGYPGDAHIKPNELIGNPENVEKIKNILKENGLRLDDSQVKEVREYLYAVANIALKAMNNNEENKVGDSYGN